MSDDIDAATTEAAVVRSVHAALRARYQAITAAQPNPFEWRRVFAREYEHWRYALASARVLAQAREALARLLSYADGSPELREHWPLLVALWTPQRWTVARDLALIALASYRSPEGRGERRRRRGGVVMATEESLRRRVTGTYRREDLRRLQWPIAWSGTVDAETRRAREEELAELVAEAMEALDACRDGAAVEIAAGEIVAVVVD